MVPSQTTDSDLGLSTSGFMYQLIEWLLPLTWRAINYSVATLAGVLALGIYRVFLHPLGHVPGPKLAAATSLYEFYYDGWLGGKYYWEILELHQQYGKANAITLSRLAQRNLQCLLCEFRQTRSM